MHRIRIGLALIALSVPALALGAPGDPDASFGGGDGKVSYGDQNDEKVAAIAQARDGKIVAVGQIGSDSKLAVLRLHESGGLDSSFGTGGIAVHGGIFFAAAVAALDEGKILTAGTAYGDMVLARLGSAGALDPGFGSGGKVAIDFGPAAAARDMAVQPDGRIVVAGEPFSGASVLVARALPDGAPDPAFAGGGMTSLPVNAADVTIRAVAVLPSGKIAIAGAAKDGTGRNRVLAVRLNRNGTPDASFGPGGIRVYELGSDHSAAVDVLAYPTDELIVVCQTYEINGQGHFALLRVAADGLVNHSEITDLGVDSMPRRGAIRADGKIVVVGTYGSSLAIHQYLPSLDLDPSFGKGGVSTMGFVPSAHPRAEAVLVQGDGKILAGGWSPQTPPLSDQDFAFARVHGTGAPLLSDDFNDGVINWTQVTGAWSESNGYLSIATAGVARTDTPAVWSPSGVSGCSSCTIRARLGFLAGGTSTKLTVLAWDAGAANRVQLTYADRTGNWVLKQRANGSSIRRRVKAPMSQLYGHDIGLSYTGSHLLFSLDGMPLLRMPALAPPSGSAGFQIENGALSLHRVLVH